MRARKRGEDGVMGDVIGPPVNRESYKDENDDRLRVHVMNGGNKCGRIAWLEELYSSAYWVPSVPKHRPCGIATAGPSVRPSRYRDIGPVILSVEIRRAHELAVFLTECKSIPQCDDSRLSV